MTLRAERRAGRIVAMSVCGGAAEASMRPFRNGPKSPEILIKVPKLRMIVLGEKFKRGTIFGCRGGNRRRLVRRGAGWSALSVALRYFRRFPIQRTDARAATRRNPGVGDTAFVRIAGRRAFASVPSSAGRAHHQKRDHGRRVAEHGGPGKQSDGPDLGPSARAARRGGPGRG